MSHTTVPPSSRTKPLPVTTIEHNLNEIQRRLDHELSTPQTGRDAATYQHLADLHRSEARWWKEYLATARVRLAWLAASAAADRAHQLAVRYQNAASASPVDPTEQRGRRAP